MVRSAIWSGRRRLTPSDAFRAAGPFLLGFGLILVTHVALRSGAASYFTPNLGLIYVFFWASRRPDRLPGAAVFALGLLQDMWQGGPVGLHALLFLLTWSLIASQIKFFLRLTFLVRWWLFLLVAGGAGIAEWLITGLVHAGLPSPTAGLVQWFSTLLVYPFVTWAIFRVRNAILE